MYKRQTQREESRFISPATRFVQTRTRTFIILFSEGNFFSTTLSVPPTFRVKSQDGDWLAGPAVASYARGWTTVKVYEDALNYDNNTDKFNPVSYTHLRPSESKQCASIKSIVLLAAASHASFFSILLYA